eukprot:CAMPEP_0179345226 /NCGR_PEP_ID=MMETSP0797-20121207/71928_1 /TAXON_ID=47934 /ORGANISM="Dinophysis acuminata, Strain DAEP01" /LENGTH=38 /DNA_ID= /DNA_START= /DNA_END= /DNA_ORIENTATION=
MSPAPAARTKRGRADPRTAARASPAVATTAAATVRAAL